MPAEQLKPKGDTEFTADPDALARLHAMQYEGVIADPAKAEIMAHAGKPLIDQALEHEATAANVRDAAGELLDGPDKDTEIAKTIESAAESEEARASRLLKDAERVMDVAGRVHDLTSPTETGEPGSDLVEDPKKAKILARAAQPKMDEALERAASARRFVAEAADPNIQEAPLTDFEERAATIATGREGSIKDLAELKAVAATAEARAAAKLRDEAERDMKHAERVYELGEKAAEDHPDRIRDQLEVHNRAIGRELEDKIAQTKARIDRDAGTLGELRGSYNPAKIWKRWQIRREVIADHKSLDELRKRQAGLNIEPK